MTQVCIESPYEEQIKDLQGFIKKERDARQVKKALAVKLLYQGYKHEAIVQILEVAMGSITSWREKYESEGLAGFRPKHKGRKSYLSQEQREQVLNWLQSKKIWELSELGYHLASEYGVGYESKQSYYNLFDAAGISWKKTTKVNPKADAQEVAAKKWKSNGCWRATERRSFGAWRSQSSAKR